jgi:hypothetical protein
VAYDDDYIILTLDELAQASDRLGRIARTHVRAGAPDDPPLISDAHRALMREVSEHVAKLGQLVAAGPGSAQMDSNPGQRTNPRTAESPNSGTPMRELRARAPSPTKSTSRCRTCGRKWVESKTDYDSGHA